MIVVYGGFPDASLLFGAIGEDISVLGQTQCVGFDFET